MTNINEYKTENELMKFFIKYLMVAIDEHSLRLSAEESIKA